MENSAFQSFLFEPINANSILNPQYNLMPHRRKNSSPLRSSLIRGPVESGKFFDPPIEPETEFISFEAESPLFESSIAINDIGQISYRKEEEKIATGIEEDEEEEINDFEEDEVEKFATVLVRKSLRHGREDEETDEGKPWRKSELRDLFSPLKLEQIFKQDDDQKAQKTQENLDLSLIDDIISVKNFDQSILVADEPDILQDLDDEQEETQSVRLESEEKSSLEMTKQQSVVSSNPEQKIFTFDIPLHTTRPNSKSPRKSSHHTKKQLQHRKHSNFHLKHEVPEEKKDAIWKANNDSANKSSVQLFQLQYDTATRHRLNALVSELDKVDHAAVQALEDGLGVDVSIKRLKLSNVSFSEPPVAKEHKENPLKETVAISPANYAEPPEKEFEELFSTLNESSVARAEWNIEGKSLDDEIAQFEREEAAFELLKQRKANPAKIIYDDPTMAPEDVFKLEEAFRRDHVLEHGDISENSTEKAVHSDYRRYEVNINDMPVTTEFEDEKKVVDEFVDRSLARIEKAFESLNLVKEPTITKEEYMGQDESIAIPPVELDKKEGSERYSFETNLNPAICHERSLKVECKPPSVFIPSCEEKEVETSQNSTIYQEKNSTVECTPLNDYPALIYEKELVSPRKKILLEKGNLEMLSNMSSNVMHLSAQSNQLTKLTSFVHLQHLQYVDVSDNQIDNLSGFYGLLHLQTLIIDRNQLSQIGDLSSLPSLQKLSARENKIISIDSIVSDSLSHLDLFENFISAPPDFSSCPCLCELILEQNQISTVDLRSNSLENVNISFNNISQFSAVNLPRLSKLNLDSNRLSGSCLEISPDNHLKHLSCRSQRSFSELNIHFTRLTKLLSLDLSQNFVSFLNEILSLNRLESLKLQKCHLKTLSSKFNRKLKNLQILDLSDNMLSEMEPLRRLKHLQSLNLQGNELKSLPSCIDILLSLPALDEVDLRMNPITAKFYPNRPNCCSQEYFEMDKLHLQSLNDFTFIRRMCYRSTLISELAKSHKLKMLDGLKVSDEDRELAAIQYEKLRRKLNNARSLQPTPQTKQDIFISGGFSNDVKEIVKQETLKKPTHDEPESKDGGSTAVTFWIPIENQKRQETSPRKPMIKPKPRKKVLVTKSKAPSSCTWFTYSENGKPMKLTR